MNNQVYFERFEKDILSGEPVGVVSYFDGHRPRFETQIAMFSRIEKGEVQRVYDFGTHIPFTSYFFNLRDGAEVIYGMPGNYRDINSKTRFMDLNLCRPPKIKKADMIICTECLEHLPCPLLPVVDFLKSLVRSGGYMLLSFPFGPVRHGDWETDFGEYEKIRNEHLREFDHELAEKMMAYIGWERVESELTFTHAYGGNILNVLLRNKKVRKAKELLT